MLNALIRLAYNNKQLRPSLMPLLRLHTAKIVIPVRPGEQGFKLFVARLAKQLREFVNQWVKYQSQLSRGSDAGDLSILLREIGAQSVLEAVQSWSVVNFLKTAQQIQKLPSLEDAYYTQRRLLSDHISEGLFAESFERSLDNLGKSSSKLSRIVEAKGLAIDLDVLKTLRKMAKLYRDFQKEWDLAKERYAIFQFGDYADDKLPKGSAKYETLYHASLDARGLFTSGFQSEVPSQAGLGGPQNAGAGKKGTSFTYDLHIAKEISRTFKELVLVAKGKVSAEDILEWVVADGIVLEVFDRIEMSLRLEDTARVKPTGTGVEFMLAGKPVGISKVFDTPLLVAALYLKYLRVLDDKGKRYNPVVMNIWRILPKLAATNYKDIGVVVATVDMSHPGVKHISGERELRVPPDAIVSVDKFLS